MQCQSEIERGRAFVARGRVDGRREVRDVAERQRIRAVGAHVVAQLRQPADDGVHDQPVLTGILLRCDEPRNRVGGSRERQRLHVSAAPAHEQFRARAHEAAVRVYDAAWL